MNSLCSDTWRGGETGGEGEWGGGETGGPEGEERERETGGDVRR